MAQAALYLASDMASYVTGVALPVDGGFLAEKSFVSGSGRSSFLAGNETSARRLVYELRDGVADAHCAGLSRRGR